MSVPQDYRKSAGEARVVHVLDFDQLPVNVQERLVRSLRAGGAPAPLVRAEDPRGGAIPGTQSSWITAGIVGALVVVFLWFMEFGDLRGRFSVQPLPFAALHVLVASLLVLTGMALVILHRSKAEGAPFPSGRYLFPLDLVECHGRILHVTSLSTLRRVEPGASDGHPALSLVFGDGTASIALLEGDPTETAEQAKAAIDEATNFVFGDDQPQLERLDPFYELRIADDWARAEVAEKAEKRTTSFRWLALASLAAGALLGFASFYVRNYMSDESMFEQVRDMADHGTDGEFEHKADAYEEHGARHVYEIEDLRFGRVRGDMAGLAAYLARNPHGKHAIEADDEFVSMVKANASFNAYEAYLRDTTGRRHIDEIDDAMFTLAKKQGTSVAYETYVSVRPKRHMDEVQNKLLPEAWLREGEREADVGKLGSIVKYDDENWRAVVDAAIHRVYSDTLSTLRRPRGEGWKETRAIFEPLLMALDEAKKPYVRLDVKAFVTNDFLSTEMGLMSKYERYVPVGAGFPLENADIATAVAEEIVNRTRAAFGKTMSLSTQARVDDDTRPKLVVHLTPVAGEDHFASTRDGTMFCDMRLKFAMWAEIPGKPPTPTFTFETAHAKNFEPNLFDKLANTAREVTGGTMTTSTDAYAAMIRGAPYEIGLRLRSALEGRSSGPR